MQFFRRRTIYDYYQAEHIIRHTKNAVFIDLLYLQYWLNCLDTNNTYFCHDSQERPRQQYNRNATWDSKLIARCGLNNQITTYKYCYLKSKSGNQRCSVDLHLFSRSQSYWIWNTCVRAATCRCTTGSFNYLTAQRNNPFIAPWLGKYAVHEHWELRAKL